MRIPTLILVALSITLIAGCRTVAVIPVGTHSTVTHSQHIYPPLYPSHGYRHHYNGHELVYDSDYGAYYVLGFGDVYFYNDLYFRFYSGAWQTTNRLNGSWRYTENRQVPRKLRDHRRYKKNHRHSLPPHAPAHGHRHSHKDGVDLIFDSGIGAYIVLGFDDLFFFDNHYMRFYDGYWHYADRYNGRWLRANDRHVPYKLRKARNRNKEGLFKKIKKQYRKEHQEIREYRTKHSDRRDNAKRDKRDKQRENYIDERDDQRERKKNNYDDKDDNSKKERRENGWLR